LRTDSAYESVSGYGVLLAQLGKVGLFIRGLQQIKWIVPHDPNRAARSSPAGLRQR
jgi:hypothetical protein